MKHEVYVMGRYSSKMCMSIFVLKRTGDRLSRYENNVLFMYSFFTGLRTSSFGPYDVNLFGRSISNELNSC